jgi:hypothetical protein
VAQTYLLDSNIFIEAAKRYYAFDLVPTFWDKIVENAESGNIITIDRVLDEVLVGQDDLADWCYDNTCTWCKSTNVTEIGEEYKKVIQRVYTEDQYKPEQKTRFAGGADGWLIAYANINNCCLVTQETYDRNTKKVKIPNVCRFFGTEYDDIYGMMRALSVRI